LARPAFSPTPDQRRAAKLMAGFGTPQEQIAQILEIAPRTLRKYFRAELDRGKAEANAKVLQTLFSMATSAKNTAATIFWIKTQCAWLRAPDKQDAPGHQPVPPKSPLPGWLLRRLREQSGQPQQSSTREHDPESTHE